MPGAVDTQHYDLSAKVPGDARTDEEQMRPMLRSLLEERLHLAVHHESRIVSGYALVIAKGGSKLKPNTGKAVCGDGYGLRVQVPERHSAGQIAIEVESELACSRSSTRPNSSMYDFDPIFTRDHPTDTPHPDYGDLFTAIQKQLGLKLEPQKIPVDYLVIDHIERIPTEN